MIIASALLTALLFANLQAMEQPDFTIDLSKLLIVNAEAPAEKTPPRVKTRPQKGSKVLDSSGEDISPLIPKRTAHSDGYSELHHACMCLSKKQYKKKATTRLSRIQELISKGEAVEQTDAFGLSAPVHFLISLADRNMKDFTNKESLNTIIEICKALHVTKDHLYRSINWYEYPDTENHDDRPHSDDSQINEYLAWMACEHKVYATLGEFLTKLFGADTAQEVAPNYNANTHWHK